MIGLTLGDYRVGARVGSGGVGDVYRATDLMLERDVAIKFLRPGLGAQPELVERFRSEARTLAQLHHPNIATLYALHREGDTLAMIMELVDGKTVSTLLAESGRLELDVALAIMLQALDGIGCAHASGVVHRDLKPSNLMLNRAGVLKVMDFGIARCVGADRVTRAGNTVGTAQYMSPEQVRGQDTDARSDVYSLAIVLYEMLTDRLPFDHEVEYETMRAHVESEPIPPRIHVPEIPEAIEAAILRGLAKSPDARFASTGELREALLAAVGGRIDVGASELGLLVGSGASQDSDRTSSRRHAIPSGTELLLCELPAAEESDALVGPALLGPEDSDDGPDSTVWEIPELLEDDRTTGNRPSTAATGTRQCARTPSGPYTAVSGERATLREARAEAPLVLAKRAGRSRWSRVARVALQATGLVLVAVSVGTPSGHVVSTPSRDAARDASGGASPPGIAAIEPTPVPVPWPDTAQLDLPQVAPEARSAPLESAAEGPAEPLEATTSTTSHEAHAAPRPPRPKPARLARKARSSPADEGTGLRTFVEPASPDEAPDATRAGEWLLRR